MIARLYNGFPDPPGRGKLRMRPIVANEETFAVLEKTMVQRFNRRIPANDLDGYRW